VHKGHPNILKMKTSIIISIVLIGLSFCNKPVDQKTVAIQNGSCVAPISGDSIRSKVFPFEFVHHNSNKLLTSYFKYVKVDSVEKGEEGYRYWVYTYADSVSRIQFMVKPITDEEPWFYLEKSVIKSNIFLDSLPIFIGITKSDFSKYIPGLNSSCDTIKFAPEELGPEYRFLFINDKLKSIEIIPSD